MVNAMNHLAAVIIQVLKMMIIHMTTIVMNLRDKKLKNLDYTINII
jgi:hypothetical protein